MLIYTIDDIKNNMNDLTLIDLLCQSARLNYLDGIKHALKNNVNINIHDCFPLRTSVYNNNIKVVKYLIRHGADINVPYDNPLLISIKKNNFEIFKYLIENGADIKNIDFNLLDNETKNKIKISLREIKIKNIIYKNKSIC